MTPEFNDDLSDLLGRTEGGARPLAPHTPEFYREQKPAEHIETCPKCRGTGCFISYSGRALGPCFACKGAGKKTFKASAESRAKSRQQAATRKATNEAERVCAFKAAHPAAWAWLEKNPAFEFAASLRNAVAKFGALSEPQMAAVERGIARDAARAEDRQARVDNAKSVDVSKIETAFATARERAQRKGQVGIWMKPLRLKAGEQSLILSEGSAGSQWAGMLFVKTDDGRKLGHVKGGKFVRRFECTDAQEAAVLDACQDPAKAAVAYGKAFGVCAVCGLTLTNDKSMERGIGPICAEKFGF